VIGELEVILDKLGKHKVEQSVLQALAQGTVESTELRKQLAELGDQFEQIKQTLQDRERNFYEPKSS
jgi:hypothetical protein